MKLLTYNESLGSLRAFIPNSLEVIEIIKSCYLKHTSDWSVWKDGSGNQLVINKNKEVSININKNSSILTDEIRDIYFKSNAKTVSNNSIYATIAMTDDMKTYVFWFEGKDKCLRMMLYKEGSWSKHFFPLTSGIDALRFVLLNKITEIGFKSSILPWSIPSPYNLNIKKVWNTSWPPTDNLKEDLLLTNEDVTVRMLDSLGF
jgi:hypothetical protein